MTELLYANISGTDEASAIRPNLSAAQPTKRVGKTAHLMTLGAPPQSQTPSKTPKKSPLATRDERSTAEVKRRLVRQFDSHEEDDSIPPAKLYAAEQPLKRPNGEPSRYDVPVRIREDASLRAIQHQFPHALLQSLGLEPKPKDTETGDQHRGFISYHIPQIPGYMLPYNVPALQPQPSERKGAAGGAKTPGKKPEESLIMPQFTPGQPVSATKMVATGRARKLIPQAATPSVSQQQSTQKQLPGQQTAESGMFAQLPPTTSLSDSFFAQHQRADTIGFTEPPPYLAASSLSMFPATTPVRQTSDMTPMATAGPTPYFAFTPVTGNTGSHQAVPQLFGDATPLTAPRFPQSPGMALAQSQREMNNLSMSHLNFSQISGTPLHQVRLQSPTNWGTPGRK